MTDPGSGAAVTARALSLRGPRGWVYRDVDLAAGPGTLAAVEGPAGSGRTSLLLTLAGRMRPTGGEAAVDGLELPRQAARVRRIAALGHMPGVNQPDPALTVGEHLRERRLLHAPVLSLLGRGRDRQVSDALARAGLAVDGLPRGARTPVRDLDALQLLRLTVGLALAGRPRLLCVDDTDDRLHAGDREAVWRLLRSVAEDGVTVLAATTDAAAAGGLAGLVVRLPGGPADDAPDAPRDRPGDDACPAGGGDRRGRGGRSGDGTGSTGGEGRRDDDENEGEAADARV
ncbi:ATP-binding cassette domain-containing protein [Streptacidiphilus sp. ASG 303]|uniref:ABC transporter ATP-binding protein n=1 Tax=Streptacidiphilus sp. ASG 303 TaxID=2896847 RepID=UPI001E2F3350|nr:ATP-binding cassette domain-containing protein [Streptacidiphilus sp. ASG 303]MCD0481645.1 ATP-binding cassette domain-containing protein [Streptacidiphilus sp. ASG 303]